MKTDTQAIEATKTKYESMLIEIDGVEMVSIGLGKDGQPCLMIGLSTSEEQVSAKLPEALHSIPVEFRYVGKIEAQSQDEN